MTRGGLPHSDIPGSKLVCSSPGLFAACHVLHRLLAPRHSPYTLSSLTIRNSKLTLTNCLHISWSATVPLKHCVCLWSEKTTVCRIFSCQRSVLPAQPANCLRRLGWCAARAPLAHLRGSAQAALTTAADVGARETRRASLAHRNFFQKPLGFVRRRQSALGRTVKTLQPSRLACQPKLAFVAGLPSRSPFISGRRLVENTGLEPVTSWLQTRRSPS